MRVIDDRPGKVPDAESTYRLLTSILDTRQPPPRLQAALHHECRKSETAPDEQKTDSRGAQIVLRIITPKLVEQNFRGLLMARFAIPGLLHPASLPAGEAPGSLLLLHAARVVPRRLARYAAIPPSAQINPA